ncbi:Metalloenzyme, LuxS/M16 peptidase-like protein [Plectosphaerella cucumerina]|uniref:Metalloenzyme, LuxS/M16 peptidase-like protein n=1 Tax=Plectosphaerella cucumerina TaxID=40658 RepID=A0A8K0XAI0_9PEZI|nr:Metalloenzyme, LuxS/M16 peptidase-like protein [Plectosphaerella cucumerina]
MPSQPEDAPPSIAAHQAALRRAVECVLLVHDPDIDKASAALDCYVGSFSDEDDMPGMAHAVEHLLFMGTKKYPVSARPANDEEPTDENPSALKGALDRFAQFFIELLFLASAVDRELHVVDSENRKNLQDDAWRMRQLEKSLSNPNHPYCHFSTGNFEVLKTQPESRGIDVLDRLMEFYAKHYSANRMKLVIMGREPLGVLENWARDFFSAVPDKNLAQNRWEDEELFRKSDLGVQIFAKPIMDFRQLLLCFPFLDEEYLFESQPSRYISHLIGHTGPGSIKSKGWANGLRASARPVCPGTIIFQYISMLRETPPPKWIFDEQKGMSDIDFKFKQKTPASTFTSEISSVMQKPLPREWFLSGHI